MSLFHSFADAVRSSGVEDDFTSRWIYDPKGPMAKPQECGVSDTPLPATSCCCV